MRNRADIYRQKAHECDRAVTRVADPQVQASYRQIANGMKWLRGSRRSMRRWLTLAELLKPLECGADFEK
jgi:hypothetical protein